MLTIDKIIKMSNLKKIRWQQRFSNFEKAFKQLQQAVLQADKLDNLSKEGLIQRFEYTFELCWKTLKDYLESKGELDKSPRDVIKRAFNYEIIDNGELWLEILGNRNLMAHTYNESYFNEIFSLIVNNYYQEIEKIYQFLKNEQ